MISVAGLTVRYPERRKPALHEVNLEVRRGESVLVLGASGSGKSTLTLCLDGLIPHVVESEVTGTTTVAGMSTADHPVHELARSVGLVFQDPEAQFCTLTVEDEIAFGLENLRADPAGMERQVDAALARVGLAGFRGRRLETLSGGEKQRVALASVLAMEPDVLVLDEPSANLDPAGTEQVFAVLRRLAAGRRHTLVIIEHKLDEVVDWVDRVLLLGEAGEVVFDGPPREAFHRSAACRAQSAVWRPRAAELVRALSEAGWPVCGEPLTAGETAVVLEAAPGLAARLARPPAAPVSGAGAAATPGAPGVGFPAPVPAVRARGRGRERGPEIMAVRGLSYRYPRGAQVLREVSFTLRAGELTAIAGANGAGKSTLASLLCGVLEAPAGAVFLQGTDIRSLKDSDLSARVGYVFQNPEHQFVADSVHGELAYSLSQSSKRTLTPAQDERVEATLRRFGLDGLSHANPFSLSQGQKRRLSVAAMLVRAQSVLFLDEPTFGQDQAQTAALMGMLESLLDDRHAAVAITHDMDLVAEHAHRLLVLGEGRLVFDGAPRDLFADRAAIAAAGLSAPFLARVSSLLQDAAAPEIPRDHTRDGERPRTAKLLTIAEYLAAAGRPDDAPTPPAGRAATATRDAARPGTASAR